MKKRLLSGLLVAVMLLTLLPMAALADGETGITSVGLDLSVTPPDEITNYATSGGGTVVWDPTGPTATLTFENATIRVNTGAADSGAYAVRLPDAPVEVIFKGTNSIAAANNENAYAFDCKDETTFTLTPGSTTTLTAAQNLAGSEHTNSSAIGISAAGQDITITGGGALTVTTGTNHGGNNYALNADGAAVTLTGCAFSVADVYGKVKAATVTLDGVAVPTGRCLSLSEAGSVAYEAESRIEGELWLKSGTAIGGVTTHVSGNGLISIGWKKFYFTDGAFYGGEVGQSGLNIAANPPAVKTDYTTGGERTIVWEPTLGDGGAVTGGTLTFTNARIDCATNNITGYVVKLPEIPVNVILNGTNYFSLSSSPDPAPSPVPRPDENYDENQYSAFLCGADTTFTVNDETNLTVANSRGRSVYALNNKAHNVTVLGPGTLNMGTTASGGADKAEIRSNKVALGGGVTMSGVVKATQITGSKLYLGSITIPEGKTLDLSGMHVVTKYGDVGAVNNGFLVLPDDADAQALALSGTGLVKSGFFYFDNFGERNSVGINFNDDQITWKKEATLEDDGYTYRKDEATNTHTITLGYLVIDPDGGNSGNVPAITLPDNGNVNLLLQSSTYLINGLDSYPCISASRPLTVCGNGGKLYMEASGDGGFALAAQDLALINALITGPEGAAFDAENGKIMQGGSPAKIVTIGTEPVSEQFTLTPGGTYWFDLSGETIPGERNAALPDGTLHYVPFTYAGTVNAYVLNENSSGVAHSSETAGAAADPGAQYGYHYGHSLFVADYNVTHTVSWDELDEDSLIFGKAYASGGVDYTLRAPSAGSDNTGYEETARGAPLTNEWDAILDKSVQYIENWNGIFSWGQDTDCDYVRDCGFDSVFRGGRDSARRWSSDASNMPGNRYGYRPVLEVLNAAALGADGLKAVTLDLGGGSVGGETSVSIIVKNGETFTAPGSEGLPAPGGLTLNWLDGANNIYRAGDPVPAAVTELTAMWLVVYPVSEGADSTWTGSGELTFTVEASYDDLTNVMVNRSVLDPAHYTHSEGSTIITLKQSYLDTLSNGVYALRVNFSDGYAETTFAVSKYSGGGYSYYTVTAAAGEGGSISPSGAVSVRRGLDKTFTITPNDGYVISDVLLDGVSVKGELAGGSYTIQNVSRRHTISVTFSEESETNPFADVKDSDWFFKDVLFAHKNKLMLGTSESAFSPNEPATRGMLVTILYRMAGSPSIEDEIWGYPFADVDAEAYYGTAVYWARLGGIVEGYDPEHFGPDDAVTREQLAAILYRYARHMGYETSAAMGMAGFDDADTVSPYAVSAMRWACGAGLLQGSGGRLLPQGGAERCQVAAILHRFCERFAEK